jgi:uncharacterized protein (DUF486 family)
MDARLFHMLAIAVKTASLLAILLILIYGSVLLSDKVKQALTPSMLTLEGLVLAAGVCIPLLFVGYNRIGHRVLRAKPLGWIAAIGVLTIFIHFLFHYSTSYDILF